MRERDPNKIKVSTLEMYILGFCLLINSAIKLQLYMHVHIPIDQTFSTQVSNYQKSKH